MVDRVVLHDKVLNIMIAGRDTVRRIETLAAHNSTDEITVDCGYVDLRGLLLVHVP